MSAPVIPPDVQTALDSTLASLTRVANHQNTQMEDLLISLHKARRPRTNTSTTSATGAQHEELEEDEGQPAQLTPSQREHFCGLLTSTGELLRHWREPIWSARERTLLQALCVLDDAVRTLIEEEVSEEGDEMLVQEVMEWRPPAPVR